MSAASRRVDGCARPSKLTTHRAIGNARGEAPLGFDEAPDELTIDYDEEVLRHLEEDL